VNEPKVVPIYDSNIIANVKADLSERVIWLEFDVQEEGRKALIQLAMLESESKALRDQLDAAERDIVAHHAKGVAATTCAGCTRVVAELVRDGFTRSAEERKGYCANGHKWTSAATEPK